MKMPKSFRCPNCRTTFEPEVESVTTVDFEDIPGIPVTEGCSHTVGCPFCGKKVTVTMMKLSQLLKSRMDYFRERYFHHRRVRNLTVAQAVAESREESLWVSTNN